MLRRPRSPGDRLSSVLLAVGLLLAIVAILAVLAFTGAPAPAAAQTPPTVEEFAWLGWPDAVQSVSEVLINDAGQVAITAATEIWTTRAYYRVGDQWGAIPAHQNAVGGINQQGTVAGWMTNSDSAPTDAFTWDPGGGLFVLGGLPDGATGARGSDINDAGTLVGRVFIEQGGSVTAWPFRLGDDGLEVLLGSVPDGEPMALNEAGEMVVRAFEDSGNALYLIAPDDTVSPLPPAPWDLANPLDLNDQGWIVGDAETGDFSVDEAFVFDGEQYALLPLPAGFTSADAEAVNDLGQIAGWGWDGSFGAVVWQDGAGFDLGAVVSDHLGTSVDLAKAFSITDEGWVAGWGQGPGGGPEIFRVRLGPPCPDPASGEGMIRWTGAAGTYQDGANWSGGEVPGSDQIVHVGGEGGEQITLAGDATNQSLVLVTAGGGALIDATDHTWTLLGDQPCLPGLLTLSEDGDIGLHDLVGGTLAIGGGAALEHGGPVTLSVYGGQRWQVAGGPLIAGHPDTTRFGFDDASSITVAQETVLGLRTGERATGTITDTGGLEAQTLVLGSRGSGQLTVTDGTIQAPQVILGEIAGGWGRLAMDGETGSLLAASAALTVGEAGAGELDLVRTLATVGDLEVGSLAGSDGLALVWQEGSLLVSDATIGNAGTGRVDVLAGGELQQSGGAAVVVGASAGGAGELVISGDPSRAECVSLVIGGSGEGRVKVEQSGRLVVEQSILLGDGPGGHGDLVVSGGQVQAPSLVVGDPEGGTGAVTIDTFGVVIAEVVEVTASGSLTGPIIELGPPGGLAGAPAAGDAAGAGGAASGTASGTASGREVRDTPGALRTDVLDLAAGATVTVDSVRFGTGWALGGTGSFPFDLTNTGVVSPGASQEAGTFSVAGDYTQTAAGRLRIDVFGAGPAAAGTADRLAVAGAAALAGTLSVHLAPDAEPEVDDRHRILTAATVTGSFAHLGLPTGMLAHVEVGDGWADLVITQVPTSVPRDLPASKAVVMSPVAPNPFNPRAAFSLAVAQTQHVRVRVLDLRGREVAVVHDGVLAAGTPHAFTLDGRRWASGAYLVRAEGEDFTSARKVMLLE